MPAPSVEIHRSHVLGFLAIHFTSLIALAFWVGVTYNRVAVAEQRTQENTTAISAIQENGTAALRVELIAIREQLNRVEARLDHIAEQNK